MKKWGYLFILVGALLAACAHQTDLGVRARMAGQVRIIEKVSYEDVFKAVLVTVQNEGLKLKVNSQDTGLVLASYHSGDKSSLFSASLGKDFSSNRGEVVEFVINLEKLQDKKTKTRLSLQRIQTYNLLGNHEGAEIVDLKAYRVFYEKLQANLALKYPNLDIRAPSSEQKKKPATVNPVTGKPI